MVPDRPEEVDTTGDGACIGVHQQLGGIGAQADFRLPFPVDAEAVTLPRTNARNEDVPEPVPHGHVDTTLAQVGLHEHELDPAGIRCPKPEQTAFRG